VFNKWTTNLHYPLIRGKFKGYYIAKMPLWASTQFVFHQSIHKPYSFEIWNALLLSSAADGAFIICGFLSPHCIQKAFQHRKWNTLMIPLMTFTPPIAGITRWQSCVMVSFYWNILLTDLYQIQVFYSQKVCGCATMVWLPKVDLKMLSSTSLCVRMIVCLIQMENYGNWLMSTILIFIVHVILSLLCILLLLECMFRTFFYHARYHYWATKSCGTIW